MRDRIDVTPDGHEHHIVVAVSVGIIALPESGPILLSRQLIGMQPVCSAETIAPGDGGLRHRDNSPERSAEQTSRESSPLEREPLPACCYSTNHSQSGWGSTGRLLRTERTTAPAGGL